MKPEEWRREGQYHRRGSHRVFYRDGGAGGETGLLLVHGFPAASWSWRRVWPDLSDRERVVAPDLLGFGFSDKPPGGPYSVFDQADLLEGLLGALRLERVHVLASAYGVTVAQELLARQEEGREEGFPFRLLSCCFLNGGVFPGANEVLPAQRLLLTPIGRYLFRFVPFSYRLFRRSFSRVFGSENPPTEEELRQVWELLTRDGGKRVMHELMRYQLTRRSHGDRWVGALARTDVPTALVLGPDDPVSGEQAGRWRETVPDAPLTVLDSGVGHYPQLEAPSATVRAYRDFRRKAAAGR